MEKEKRQFEGIWISKDIWLSKDLTLQEKVFFVEIRSLDNEKGCFASNDYFAEFFGVSKTRVSEVINSLIKKGYLKNICFNGRERVLRVKEKLKAGLKKSLKQASRKVEGRVKEKFKHNNTSNNTKNNTNNNKYSIYSKNKFLRENFKDIVKSINPEPNRINDLIGVFQKTVNPTINFGNKTERDSAEKLIKFMGFEKAKALVEYSAKIQGQEFSPVITSPYSLLKKLPNLKIFYEKEKNKKPLFIKL